MRLEIRHAGLKARAHLSQNVRSPEGLIFQNGFQGADAGELPNSNGNRDRRSRDVNKVIVDVLLTDLRQ